MRYIWIMGAALSEALASMISLILIFLAGILLITTSWDCLVWLAGNMDTWPHTGFHGSIISVVGIVTIKVLVAALDGMLRIISPTSKTMPHGCISKNQNE